MLLVPEISNLCHLHLSITSMFSAHTYFCSVFIAVDIFISLSQSAHLQHHHSLAFPVLILLAILIIVHGKKVDVESKSRRSERPRLKS